MWSAAAAATVALALATVPGSAQELPPSDHDPGAVRRLADEIVARPEFRRPGPTPIQRAQRWLAESVGRVIERLVGGGGSVLGWLVLLAAAGAVVWFAIRFGRTVQVDAGQAGASVDIERRRSPADWRAEAERHESAGEWKAALRCRYRALVGDLVTRRVVADVPGRTAGEYRADVGRARPAAAAPFSGATELFERAWYGDRPTGPDDYARFRALADDVLEAVQ